MWSLRVCRGVARQSPSDLPGSSLAAQNLGTTQRVHRQCDRSKGCWSHPWADQRTWGHGELGQGPRLSQGRTWTSPPSVVTTGGQAFPRVPHRATLPLPTTTTRPPCRGQPLVLVTDGMFWHTTMRPQGEVRAGFEPRAADLSVSLLLAPDEGTHPPNVAVPGVSGQISGTHVVSLTDLVRDWTWPVCLMWVGKEVGGGPAGGPAPPAAPVASLCGVPAPCGLRTPGEKRAPPPLSPRAPLPAGRWLGLRDFRAPGAAGSRAGGRVRIHGAAPCGPHRPLAHGRAEGAPPGLPLQVGLRGPGCPAVRASATSDLQLGTVGYVSPWLGCPTPRFNSPLSQAASAGGDVAGALGGLRGPRRTS